MPTTSTVEEIFDAVFARDIASGHCAQEFFDRITDELAAMPDEKAREAEMKAILDKLFHQRGQLSHQIEDLQARPELNGSAVEVLGKSQLSADGTLRYPVRVVNRHAPFDGALLKVKPQNLHVLESRGEESEESDADDEESGDDMDVAEDGAAAQEAPFDPADDDTLEFGVECEGDEIEDALDEVFIEVMDAVGTDTLGSGKLARVQRTIRRAMTILKRVHYGPEGPDALSHTMLGKRIAYLKRAFGGGKAGLTWWLTERVRANLPDDCCPHTGRPVYLLRCRNLDEMVAWMRTGWDPRKGPLPAKLREELVPRDKGF